MKRFIRMFLLIGLFTLIGSIAHACTCGAVKAVAETNNNSVKVDNEQIKKGLLEAFQGAVFIGQVVKIEKVKVKWFDDLTRMKKVTIKVDRYWLGIKEPVAIIYTGLGGGDCGVAYAKGERYFFYADKVGGLLWTTICEPKTPENDLLNWFKEVLGEGQVFGVAKAGESNSLLPEAKHNNSFKLTRASMALMQLPRAEGRRLRARAA